MVLRLLNKCKQAINFINKCRSNEVSPTFTQFKVSNERRKNNRAFLKSIRDQISDEELKDKCLLLRQLGKEKVKLFNGPLFDLSHIDEFVMKTIFWSKVRPLIRRVDLFLKCRRVDVDDTLKREKIL